KRVSIRPHLRASAAHCFVFPVPHEGGSNSSSSQWLRNKHYVNVQRTPKRSRPKSTDDFICCGIFQQHRQRASGRVADSSFIELEQRHRHFFERFGWWALSSFVRRRHSQASPRKRPRQGAPEWFN